MNKIAVLIVAGGSGSRMQSDIPKQYLLLHNKMILRHTIDIFMKIPDILCIQCVIAPEHDRFYQQAVDDLALPAPIHGGKTRQESVLKGLEALESENFDYVLVHDAARPCVYPQDIHNIIQKLDTQSAVTLAQPLTETMQRNGQTIPRENTWIIQTPQGFHFQNLLACHKNAIKDQLSVTDDTTIMAYYGYDTIYVPCGRHNLKITTQDDFDMAKILLRPESETRIGNGFDVHAFDNKGAETIRLCGIDIPYNRSLKGHSDADVGLHALTDAIFGALADGDIGSHFPPSDQTYKDMDSHIFLDKAVDNLKNRGGKINHIDITFMCEEPKIGKHRESIRHHLSNHLNLSTSRISVKATTTEKLGFTGRGEGIACQAIVTIEIPADD